ncbi:PREDICTED: sorting nexin-17-like [Amphimedon queenslandica]|uniref:PX domain-containing protein n=1 Tax=Amphimedon queenslandica TaxID=400682 RepID=A0A1X7UZJ5_AMPQE|nr:PREDICTED: sorting nexin-17-like [Amphimedon queenslandica]|eukprot:XP_003386341.1 PREDICTED: sorting nexin-17-like [Amphimedon queenslandica]
MRNLGYSTIKKGVASTKLEEKEMHIHIPSISDALDSKGSKFKVFDIYVNGLYHGSVRYSQLLDLHNEVKVKYSSATIVDFPAKVFMISEAQLHERRRMLERYVHCLAQDRNIGSSDMFQDFMLSCQQISSGEEDKEVEIDVYLSNEKSKKIKFSSFDRSPHVLEATCKSIGVSEDLTHYFGLFMEYSIPGDKWKTLHCLSDFQCPYLSLCAANRSEDYKFRLTIKKWFFSPKFLTDCLSDSTALNMIYIETIRDIDTETLTVPDSIKDKLVSLKKSGKRKEFIETLSSQPTCLFGYNYCEGLLFNDQSTSSALAGGTKIVLKDIEKVYPISKMRCWKVGVLRGNREHFFSFEYEYSHQKFVWVVLKGVSTILLAQSITRAVEEFLVLSKNKSIRKPSENLFSRRPERPFPSFELTLGPPAGEDIHMAAAASDSQSPSIVRTESQSSSKDSEVSTDSEENNTSNTRADIHVTTPTVTPTTSNESPSLGGGGGGTYVTSGSSKKTKSSGNKKSLVPNYVKSKKKDEEEIAFNPTFLSDADL